MIDTQNQNGRGLRQNSNQNSFNQTNDHLIRPQELSNLDNTKQFLNQSFGQDLSELKNREMDGQMDFLP